jgi:hypothetical protein
MKSMTLKLLLAMGLPTWVNAQTMDCSDVYGKPAQCARVPCDAKYQTFLGTWKGPFHA